MYFPFNSKFHQTVNKAERIFNSSKMPHVVQIGFPMTIKLTAESSNLLQNLILIANANISNSIFIRDSRTRYCIDLYLLQSDAFHIHTHSVFHTYAYLLGTWLSAAARAFTECFLKSNRALSSLFI